MLDAFHSNFQCSKRGLNVVEQFKIIEIFDKPEILKIVDAGKLKIKDLIGPVLPSQLDSKGRAPGDPHYGHSH